MCAHAVVHVQVPPIFSAIKIGGRKMYEVARAGETVPRNPRPVTVEQFRVWRDDASSPLVRYKVVCSKGTYVRSLVHDLVRLTPASVLARPVASQRVVADPHTPPRQHAAAAAQMHDCRFNSLSLPVA